MSDIAVDDSVRLRELDLEGQEVLFTRARSANSFADIAVSDEQLRAIWDLAKWPPTAANTQPLRVLFVRTDDGKARLAEHMAGFNKDKTAKAPVVAVLALDTRFHDHMPHNFPARGEMYRNGFENDAEGRRKTGDYSAALQAAYFIMAVRARGLAAGPMAGFDADGVDKEFFPDGRWRSTLAVNIGHPGPDAWFPRLPRLADEDVLAWA